MLHLRMVHTGLDWLPLSTCRCACLRVGCLATLAGFWRGVENPMLLWHMAGLCVYARMDAAHAHILPLAPAQREIANCTPWLTSSCCGNADMTTNELMQLGRKEIVETDEALVRAQRVVANTIEVGTKTAETLQAQTQQMERVLDDLDEIKFSLKKASKVIRDITRSMATDKCGPCSLPTCALLHSVRLCYSDVVLPEAAAAGPASCPQAWEPGNTVSRTCTLTVKRADRAPSLVCFGFRKNVAASP